MNNKGAMALSQIFILVMGVVAFGFIVGGMGVVRGGDPSSMTTLKNYFLSSDTSQYGAFGSDATKKWLGPTFGDAHSFFGNTYVQTFAQSAAWAGIAYGVVTMVAGLFGAEDELTHSLASAASAGFGTGKLAYNLASSQEWVWAEGWFGEGFTGFGATAGIVAAAIVFFLTYKKTKESTYEYTCEAWEAPAGGRDCAKCNQQGILPCSEYQCRSLGQACELENVGTEEEKCIWVNSQDVKFPIITPWDDALLEDYEYTPDNTISPPDRGVIIENTLSEDKCVKAFTPLNFGIELNEPGKCKIDYLRKPSFDEMQYYFGGSQLFRYNHTQIMSLPGKAAYEAENIEINNDGNYELYVRCQDKNENFNTANFVFKFCVDQGPDTTAPAIVTTSLINDMPVGYDISEADLIVYINEPAECKWSKLDEEYDAMTEIMDCSQSVTNMNAQMLYECETTLTGLENDNENKFYFRCKDQPIGVEEGNRNTNTESYEFNLMGTIPLILNEVGPNGTVRENTDLVKVTLTAETSAGAEEGKSICFYSDEATGSEERYIEFYSTSSYTHSQDLYLPEGEHTYYIKCVDLGGNSDEKSVNFYVESDAESPIVVRAYREDNNLKLITSEESECVYDVLNCNYLFDDGIALTSLNGENHFVEWDSSKNYYVKCKDEYGNQPLPNQCSIVAKPFEIHME
ncbi:hypothetical protein HN832_02615 [archaeon]|jgi:hypothetical protein|nr:hypothetical protein [archaeon]MBT4373247.1 hypothetical protein [archaeon]MBT4531592.1 hypothetical protein [archaeon]MBT7001230.1 hypothetical protein [archaeon]MBT7282284.1 hypothetical protein [archaeon]